ncbi:MAG: MalY/PatB family protein [Fusobacteriaceae bacterium]
MKFDEIINRKGTYCTQWDYIEDRFGEGTKDLIPFSISDTDFKSPEPIIDAIIKRAKHGIFGYSRWNHSDYKDAIENWYQKRYDTKIEKNWIVYSPTVIYSITTILGKLVKINEKIMTHTPRYDGFTKILKGYQVVEIKLLEDINGIYQTDFIKIEEGFKNGVKVFLLCNPENPTGKVWSYLELKKLTELCNKYDVILLSDEIHMDIARKNVTPVLKLDKKNSIIVSSASKTFNTPSLGGSYVIIPDIDIRNGFITHIKEKDSLSSPNIFGIISTMVAYNECEQWVDELNKYITANCQFVVNELNGYKGLKVSIPEGTYLMWIDFKNTKITLEELKKSHVEVGKVAIMSGENYGDKYKLRLNVGCPLKKLKVGVIGIKRAIDNLKQ